MRDDRFFTTQEQNCQIVTLDEKYVEALAGPLRKPVRAARSHEPSTPMFDPGGAQTGGSGGGARAMPKPGRILELTREAKRRK